MSLHRSMAVTESSFCHLGRPDWRTLRRAVLQALFVVLLYLPLAKVQALPPDPAREARLEGWIDAGLARGGSAAGDVSALAVCPTHTWVTPTGGSVTVRMVQASTTSTFAASVSKLTFSDSSTALAFCTDIHHGLGSSVVVCLDETFFSDWRVAWVVTNYPPTTSSRTDQAARQAAVWHLTDAYDLDQTDPTTEGTSTDNAVRTAYNDILNAIPATQPSEYQEGNVDLSIDPATDTNFLPGGEVHPFAVRLTKGGSPLAGVTVNVSTSLGTLNKSSDVTNASGEAYFTVTRSTAGTATLTASASVTLPAGSRFISQSDPLGSQRLVLGQNKTTSTTATGSKIWSSSNNVVIAHKFEDRNFNGVQDEGEPNLSGWSFTLTRPDGNSYSQTTNSSGDATFNNRISGNGTYALTESLQSGWDSSTPLARTRVRSTTDAWMQWHENFGNGQYSIITVVKYRDDDEDAAWDSGSEPTLSGWQFALYDWQGGQWNQLSGATTGDDGTASFTDLTSGSFKIVEHPENCWRSTTATEQQITLGYNQHLTVYFGNVPDNPTPDATAQPSSGCSPLAVQLSGSVTGGTAPYTYTWSFGDGNPNSNTQNPSHTYANPGSYTATLTVTDTKGCTGSDSVIVTVYGHPSASASASPTSGCMPRSVNFSGGASGGAAPYTYSWNFGDSSSSPTQNPSHNYTSAGSYTATLTVTDSHGCTATSNVAITVWPLPIATAQAQPSSGCSPLSVSFTGSASGGTPGYTYSWNFGDGSAPIAAQNPVHTYSTPGDYSAVLTVTDSHGCQDTDTVLVHAYGKPTAQPSASPTSGCVPLAVHFTGAATGGTSPYGFLWDFGDGSPTSTLQNPDHTYTSAGIFIASLQVTDAHGCTDSKTVQITVWSKPTATASGVPTAGCAPLLVSFSGGASGGTPGYTYSWNFGDGGTSTAQSPSHTYTGAGSYTAVLTVTDSHGCQGSQSVVITVYPLPTATATAAPSAGCAPLAVSFTGGASGGTSPYTYSWVFGDGGTSTAQSPSHTYTSAGSYTAVLTVTDSHGCQGSKSVVITVYPLPTASASASPTSGCMPLNVSFTGGASGGTGPYTYSWVFGDSGTSTAQSPSHTYTGAGSYTAVLTVTDSHSCQGSKSVVITVYPLPTATATAAPSAGCAPLSVSFTGGASGGTSPYTYSWVFGDGGTSPNQNPSHTYSAAGNYTAFLTVTDSHGCQDTEQVVITVYPLPIATASAAPHTGCSPLAVAFAGSATGGTQPYSYSWNFGDSSPINNTQNPGHTYTTPGTYTAVLTVTDSHGCQDTDQVTITVYPLPVARIAAPETAGCAPFQADLHGEASSGTPPYSFHWAFGDGGSADGQDVQHTYTGAGHYTAILTVTDSHGCQDTESIQLEVWEVPTPHASAEPAAGCAPLQVHFTGSATGGTEPYSYFWLLGDGSAMSHEQNPTYTFAHAGTYTARLSVTDDHGCTSSTTVVITVYPLPTATASSEQTQGCAPLTCNFSGGAAGGTPGYSYHWTFGDGATSDEQSPQHTYTLAGSYTAILTVTDSHGCQDTDRVAMTVWPLPVPTIGAEPEQGCAPIQVHFSGSATSGTAPYSFHWEFGDGGTSDEQNPDHVYLNKGVYSARLTVTDAHGCVSTVERTFDASCFNLSISKKDRLDPVCIKDYIRYDITLHNSGLLPLNGVSVVDSLPDHTYYVDSDMGGVGTYGNPVVTWLVDVPAGATIQLYLELGTSSTAPPGVITNTVSASIYEFSTTFTENTTLKGCPVITDTPTQTPTPTRTQTRTPTPTQTGTPTPQGVTPTVPIPGFPLCPVCAQNVIFQSNRDQQWEIYKSNPEGTAQVRLTFNPAQDMAPQWVPAGDAVWAVFQSDRDHNWEIYRMDADGSGQRNLTQNAADDTAPAATCRWIYFQSNRDGNWEIYRMEFNGTLQTRLTDNPATDAQPASSCYERVVFQSNRDGNWELYSMNYDGSDLVRLTNTPWDEVSPSWSPDGNSIAFQSNQSGNWGLYVMDYSGAHVRTLIDTPYAEQSPMWWTCCDWIYFQSDKPALPRAADDTPIWHVWRTNVTGTLSAAVTADHSQNLIDSQVAMELPAEPTLTSTPTPTHTVSPTPVPTFTPTPTLTVTPTPVETPSRPAYRIYLPILFR